jgi:predicted porin
MATGTMRRRITSPKVDLSYTHGKHAMKFGFSYNRYTKNQQLQADAAGDYGFGQGQTGNGTAQYRRSVHEPGDRSFDGLSQPQSMSIRHYVNQTTSAYVNDNWKVSPTAEPATRTSLRCSAARLGAQQRNFQLRAQPTSTRHRLECG